MKEREHTVDAPWTRRAHRERTVDHRERTVARRESIFSVRCVTADHGRPRRVHGVFTVPHVAPRCDNPKKHLLLYQIRAHRERTVNLTVNAPWSPWTHCEGTVARREHTVVHRDAPWPHREPRRGSPWAHHELTVNSPWYTVTTPWTRRGFWCSTVASRPSSNLGQIFVIFLHGESRRVHFFHRETPWLAVSAPCPMRLGLKIHLLPWVRLSIHLCSDCVSYGYVYRVYNKYATLLNILL